MRIKNILGYGLAMCACLCGLYILISENENSDFDLIASKKIYEVGQEVKLEQSEFTKTTQPLVLDCELTKQPDKYTYDEATHTIRTRYLNYLETGDYTLTLSTKDGSITKEQPFTVRDTVAPVFIRKATDVYITKEGKLPQAKNTFFAMDVQAYTIMEDNSEVDLAKKGVYEWVIIARDIATNESVFISKVHTQVNEKDIPKEATKLADGVFGIIVTEGTSASDNQSLNDLEALQKEQEDKRKEYEKAQKELARQEHELENLKNNATTHITDGYRKELDNLKNKVTEEATGKDVQQILDDAKKTIDKTTKPKQNSGITIPKPQQSSGSTTKHNNSGVTKPKPQQQTPNNNNNNTQTKPNKNETTLPNGYYATKEEAQSHAGMYYKVVETTYNGTKCYKLERKSYGDYGDYGNWGNYGNYGDYWKNWYNH